MSSISWPAASRISASRISAADIRSPVGQTPRYRRPGLSSETGTSREKNVSAASSTCGGKMLAPRPYRLRTWSAALRTVAVEATISGFTGAPEAVRQLDITSIAISNRPTVVPSAPVMRCSSSWMIRSGGRSRDTVRTAAAGAPFLAGCRLPSLMSHWR